MYRVVKTIKGRKYVYLQRTYRVGGKMKTESRYVGPVARVVRAVASRIPTLNDFVPDVGQARSIDSYVEKTQAATEAAQADAAPVSGDARASRVARDPARSRCPSSRYPLRRSWIRPHCRRC